MEFIRNNRRLGPNITQRIDSIYNTSVKFYEESGRIIYGNATYNRTEHYTLTWILTQWIGNRSFLELSPSVTRKCLSFKGRQFSKDEIANYIRPQYWDNIDVKNKLTPNTSDDTKLKYLNDRLKSYCPIDQRSYYLFYRPKSHIEHSMKLLLNNATIIN